MTRRPKNKDIFFTMLSALTELYDVIGVIAVVFSNATKTSIT